MGHKLSMELVRRAVVSLTLPAGAGLGILPSSLPKEAPLSLLV